MKLIIYSATLMMLLVLVNSEDFCTTYISQYNRFRSECTLETHIDNITSCCDLRVFQFREILPISGVYTIRKGSFDRARAYCDMNTTEGGWIVIQRNRLGSTVDFNRNYTDYERGFGNLSGDFWYGLEEMQCLTQRGVWEFRIDYEFMNRTKSYIHYTSFGVGVGVSGYPFSVLQYAGIGGEFLIRNRGSRFSTPDNDNDRNGSVNCAAQARSGFWHDGPNRCGVINPNAQPPVVAGVSVRFVEMKIRQRDCDI